ncbi:hypothetical protein JCM8202_005955 [Rhodotorula sphaerocarpa]
MNNYGLGTPSSNANSTMPTGDRKERAADDQGEVEVQWGREKLRVPLPAPSTPLSQFRATLHTMTGVPPSHQKLIYAGAVLKDDSLPMSSYGLVETDTSASSAADASEQNGRSFWDSWSLMGRKGANNKKGLKKLVMLGSATVSARVNDHLSSRKDLQDLAASSPSGSVATPAGSGAADGASASAAAPEEKVDSEETVQSRIRQIAVHKLDELEPQVKQVEVWLAQEQARRAGSDGSPDEEAPPPPKRMLLYLNENLLQGLLKLDSIEIPSGYAEARKERKEAVRRMQEVLDRVDSLREGWKKLGLSLA